MWHCYWRMVCVDPLHLLHSRNAGVSWHRHLFRLPNLCYVVQSAPTFHLHLDFMIFASSKVGCSSPFHALFCLLLVLLGVISGWCCDVCLAAQFMCSFEQPKPTSSITLWCLACRCSWQDTQHKNLALRVLSLYIVAFSDSGKVQKLLTCVLHLKNWYL